MSADLRRQFLAAFAEAADLGLPLPEPPPELSQALTEREHAALLVEMAGIQSVFARGPAATSELPDIAGYAIERRLQGGGQGTVYLARNQGLGRLEAIKIFDLGDRDRETAQARFQREAQFLARLQHPGIVPVHHVGQTRSGAPFLAMEFIAGHSLAHVLATGQQLPPRLVARLVRDLARAADHAHSHGVIHRDIKPANILLRPAAGDQQPAVATPVLIDFGFALGLDGKSRLTGSLDAPGTLFYMAPEQVDPDLGEIDAVSDVWALGVTLFEALAGARPFAGSRGAVLNRIVHGDALDSQAALVGVPADLAAICLRCLERPRTRRFASAAELADDLDRFLQGQPTATRPLGPWQRRWRAVRRHRRPIGVAATLAAAAVFLRLAFTADARARSATNLTLEALEVVMDISSDNRLQQRGLAGAQARLLSTTVPSLVAHLQVDNDASTDRTRANGLNVLASALQLVRPDEAPKAARAAVAAYRELHDQHPDDPEIQFGLARATLSVGRLLAGTDSEAGLANTQQAIRMLEDLAGTSAAATLPKFRHQQAIALNNLANYQADRHDPAAIATYQRAIVAFRAGCATDPDCRHWLVKALSNLGLAQQETPERALPLHEEAVTIAREHVRLAFEARKEPDARLAEPWLDRDLEHRYALATALTNHGELLCALGRAHAAAAALAEALTIYQALEDAVPGYVEFAWCVAMAKSNVAWSIATGDDRARDAEAATLLEDARQWYAMALTRHPQDRDLQEYLAKNRHYQDLLDARRPAEPQRR